MRVLQSVQLRYLGAVCFLLIMGTSAGSAISDVSSDGSSDHAVLAEFLQGAIGGVPRTAMVGPTDSSRVVPLEDVTARAAAAVRALTATGPVGPEDAVAVGTVVGAEEFPCAGLVGVAAIRYWGDPEEPPMRVVGPPPMGVQLGCDPGATVHPAGIVVEVAPWVTRAVACLSEGEHVVASAWSDGAPACRENGVARAAITGKSEYFASTFCWAGCVEINYALGRGADVLSGVSSATLTAMS